MGTQWDPSNAIALMDFVTNKGLGSSMDWELGNEPKLDTQPGQSLLTPAQVWRINRCLNFIRNGFTQWLK